MNCSRCGKELVQVDEKEPVEKTEVTGQYENSLTVVFCGGYGMFFDDLYDREARRAFLCHECAHDICSMEPWIETLVEPDEGHFHDWETYQSDE
jgi:hypothetical protein